MPSTNTKTRPISGAFQTKVESQNYPPDLETLVDGVDVQGKKLKFLRKIPIDPMTHNTDWGMRSMQDDSGLRLLWRPERLRCLLQISGHGPRRHQILNVVTNGSC